MINFLLVFLALILVLLNAFFVAAEFGMVKLRVTRVKAIKNIYGLRGKILFQVHKHLDAYLSACQLGITFASLGLGWIGEPAFAHLLEPLLFFIGVNSPQLTTIIAFFVSFTFISFLHIVVGELMPKSLAIRQSERVSLWTALPLYGFYWLMFPAIWILNSCSNFLLRVFNLDAVHQGEHSYSTEEIKLLLNASHLHGELTEDEVEIIEHTFDLADLKVTEVMRFTEEMVMIPINKPMKQVMDIIMEHRYSRYPVYDPDKKDVIGIIHVKDILPVLYQQGEVKELRSLLRPMLKVSRHLPALDLLRKFREGMPHFALVYSGRKTILGFVTLDNLLQILIGRIKDEFHRTKVDWVLNDDGSISASGNCSIYSLEQAIDRDIHVDNNIDILNGLFFYRLGYVPKEGEQIDFPEFHAEIESATASKILKVKIYPNKLTDEH
ncbi:hemolysin family protein [Legionella longbeachae]|uniref:Metal ion transporter n=1 Tax=Legionella longbeachae serogroup 1 (strain NSW150) TaxID=661367 RepID=D3HSY9_LEGLN|nr:hemolysin family protein [Legionella longbeachae]VEE02520.1 metal ion transporter [Legionella oakridgensis]HBD7398780.1 HlyC/CorC family transporter [Legionella pneumophila]ARB91208.1 HlyC/CorC family transporter [Legionella longbeachae]ARM32367.1 HlyC/CorC family transporter [Legionella longbeachae]EEZ94840.1 CBS domain-containing protein [Legionella longbeachae D-4968]